MTSVTPIIPLADFRIKGVRLVEIFGAKSQTIVSLYPVAVNPKKRAKTNRFSSSLAN